MAHTFRVLWEIWLGLVGFTVLAFFAIEGYALAVSTKLKSFTLSSEWWNLAGIRKEDWNVFDWTAMHFLMAGILLLAFTFIWVHLMIRVWP